MRTAVCYYSYQMVGLELVKKDIVFHEGRWLNILDQRRLYESMNQDKNDQFDPNNNGSVDKKSMWTNFDVIDGVGHKVINGTIVVVGDDFKDKTNIQDKDIDNQKSQKDTRPSSKMTIRSYSLPNSLKDIVMVTNSKLKRRGLDGVLTTKYMYSSININTTLFEDVFRTGFGLEPYVSERGERGWNENGVLYLPPQRDVEDNLCGGSNSSVLLTMSNCTSTSTFRDSHYEAFIPFDMDTFFHFHKQRESYKRQMQKRRKIITWYAKAKRTQEMPGIEPLRKCPDFPCGITTNQQYAQKSAALVFAGQYRFYCLILKLHNSSFLIIDVGPFHDMIVSKLCLLCHSEIQKEKCL